MTGPLSKWLKIPTLAERLRAQGIREDVVQAAERTAFGRQSDRGLPAMATLLTESEGVVALVEGRHAGAIGLLVLTSRRLLFAPKAVDRTTPTSVDLPDVDEVSWRMHRGLGVLELKTGSGSFVVDQILGNQAETLGLSVQQAMAPPPDGPAAHRDPLEELAQLRVLHRAGAISDSEFQIRKHQLFGQI
jgi:hypothetical protein